MIALKKWFYIRASKILLKADARVDDLTIFKCFRLIFPLKRKLSNFHFRSIFIFNKKKNPKVVNLLLTDETLCLSFWRHKQEKRLFQF